MAIPENTSKEFDFPPHIIFRLPLSRRLETKENLAWIKRSIRFGYTDNQAVNNYDIAEAHRGINKKQLAQKTQELLIQSLSLAGTLVPAAIEAEIIDREDFEDNYRPARILLQVLLEYVERQYTPAEADASAVRRAQKLFAQIEVK